MVLTIPCFPICSAVFIICSAVFNKGHIADISRNSRSQIYSIGNAWFSLSLKAGKRLGISLYCFKQWFVIFTFLFPSQTPQTLLEVSKKRYLQKALGTVYI